MPTEPDDPRPRRLDAGGAHARLLDLFAAAIAAALPAHCVAPYLPPPPRGRCVVVGTGKASAAMAHAVEAHWPGDLSGLVVTRYGHEAACKRIEIVQAGHPLPDQAGLAAAERMLSLVRHLTADDLVLALISGGGSALLPLPAAGLTLEDARSLGNALLNCGATIGEINCVRRHLSAINGGRLATACHPAHTVSLLISDVPGDRPCDIASGPTVADASTCADALAILRHHRLEPPPAVRELLESGRGESVKPGDPRLAGAVVRVIASAQTALEAAAARARTMGVHAHILGDSIEGEARDVGRVLAAIARQVAVHGQPFVPPCVLLSGGETTVSVRGGGRGGRNVEFLLALALALDQHPRIHALAADTDGIDGLEEIAGAWIAPDTLARAHARGLLPYEALANNDAHRFFTALGDSILTGPTRTNVNDFRAILIE